MLLLNLLPVVTTFVVVPIIIRIVNLIRIIVRVTTIIIVAVESQPPPLLILPLKLFFILFEWHRWLIMIIRRWWLDFVYLRW